MRCKTSHLALALALASPLAAQADLSNQGGGDYALTPLYRALVFGGIDQGGGGFDFPDIFGTDYASNTSPLPVGSATQTVARNGATLDMNGWAAGQRRSRLLHAQAPDRVRPARHSIGPPSPGHGLA